MIKKEKPSKNNGFDKKLNFSDIVMSCSQTMAFANAWNSEVCSVYNASDFDTC